MGSGSRSRNSATYTGVFLLSLSTLTFEILLTRISSVVAWYHLAFFVISLAMIGMTAGAVWVFLRPDKYRERRETLIGGAPDAGPVRTKVTFDFGGEPEFADDDDTREGE